MLFNSYVFIFIYFPVVFFVFFSISRKSKNLGAIWLVLASLFFYAWWNPKFILLLLLSIIFNYISGSLIAKNILNISLARLILYISVAANLFLLVIFKYLNFFIETTNSIGANWAIFNIILPLGISFFTFTQIAYLVDVYRGISRESNFIHYLLFVTWFPHLIAGPVLHHKEMMPQFAEHDNYRPNSDSIAVGITFFTIGLFKKVVFADQFAVYANPVFDSAALGGQPMFFESWIGALAYTLQLYFDFSGYSDMAIGLSLMFNIKLPLNFDSPYKSASIIDFWRRWHITLSTFLRDYLYLPLGGNRRGKVRRYINLMLTMVLGGLWHGAGWCFIVWGGLHGIFLVINHAWQKLVSSRSNSVHLLTHLLSVLVTFVAVVIAWVPFRSADMLAAQNIWCGMVGLNGISLPPQFSGLMKSYLGNSVEFSGFVVSGFNLLHSLIWIPIGLFVVWFMPNIQQWIGSYYYSNKADKILHFYIWRPSRSYAIFFGFIFAISIMLFKVNSPFLYFQF